MSETQNNNHQNNVYDEISLLEIFNVLWQKKLTIISITTFAAVVAISVSLILPNKYESKAILSPADDVNSMSSALQGYSGLAGLAGISLPSGSSESNSKKAIQKINSLSFFENSIYPNIFLPDLMAHDTWSPDTNTLSYKDKKYDSKASKWVRKYSHPYKQIPSAQESLKEFKKWHFSLSEDKKTGFVTIKIKHKSPFVAKEWVELIIDEVNIFYREKDKSESEKSVNYLNKQIAMTNLSEVKEAVSKLLQEETKKLSLIEARESYVFEYIDPPAVMEKKSEPQRAIIVILSTLLGGMLAILYVLARRYF